MGKEKKKKEKKGRKEKVLGWCLRQFGPDIRKPITMA